MTVLVAVLAFAASAAQAHARHHHATEPGAHVAIVCPFAIPCDLTWVCEPRGGAAHIAAETLAAGGERWSSIFHRIASTRSHDGPRKTAWSRVAELVWQLASEHPDWQKQCLAFEVWRPTRDEFRERKLPSVATIQKGAWSPSGMARIPIKVLWSCNTAEPCCKHSDQAAFWAATTPAANACRM
jgi:hypothetical protein